MFVAAGAGSGATAAAAVAGGADLVAYYSTAAYRIRGVPTALSFLPYDNCNDLTHLISGEVVAAVAGRVPVLAGVGVHDPRVGLDRLLDQVAADGADGVMNEPFVSIYGEEIAEPLEAAGLGFGRECDLLALAAGRGMVTLGWAFDAEQAARLAGLGVDYVGAMAGVLRPGRPTDDEVADALRGLDAMAEAAHRSNPGCVVLGHGGPFGSAESIARLMRESSLDGVMTGSNGERIPLHDGVSAAIAALKGLDADRTVGTRQEGEQPC